LKAENAGYYITRTSRFTGHCIEVIIRYEELDLCLRHVKINSERSLFEMFGWLICGCYDNVNNDHTEAACESVNWM
jgi:hypothetical protein